MIKKAYFHGVASTSNNVKTGSFYDSAQLKIQWVLKEAWGANSSAVGNYNYNDWWSWDNNYQKGKRKSPRNVQRFTRFVSYCLFESNSSKNRIFNVKPLEALKNENNKEKGIDTGPFKTALRKTSVMNIIENPTQNKTTTDSRLVGEWRKEKTNVFDTIDDAKPQVLVFCIRPDLFKRWFLGDLKKKYQAITTINDTNSVLFLEDSQNTRLIIAMRHPARFSYGTATEIVNEFCKWKGIP